MLGFGFTCCCDPVTEFFDFYTQIDSDADADDVVYRCGGICPPSQTVTSYNSADHADNWGVANSLGDFDLLASWSAYSTTVDEGDYFWLYVEDTSSGDEYLQMYHAPLTGNPVQEYSVDVTGFTFDSRQYYIPSVQIGWYVVQPVRRDKINDALTSGALGHFTPGYVYTYNKEFVNNGDGIGGYTEQGVSSFLIREIDETGSISTLGSLTTGLAGTTAQRSNGIAKVGIRAKEAYPWAAGIAYSISDPDADTIRHSYAIYTGQINSSTPWEIAHTNLQETITDDVAVPAGTSATVLAGIWNAATSSGFPTYFWRVNFYDRNRNGDEVVQVVKFEFGNMAAHSYLEERWYFNGTKTVTNTSFSSNVGTYASVKAVDPDPELSTDTAFVVIEGSSLKGLDADGATVWTAATSVGSGATIIDASDRYVYVGSVASAASETTATGGRVTVDTSNWMFRLDGGLDWPFTGYSGTTQIDRNWPSVISGHYDSIKNSQIPLTPDIDLTTQFDTHYAP